MNLFSSRTARPADRRPRLSVEALEAREVLNGTSLVPPSDLVNPAVARIARAEFIQSQGTLTRTDVIDLMGVVDGTLKASFTQKHGAAVGVSFTARTSPPSGTVPPGQLTALRTLVADASLWHLTPDVANLANKVVNANPANANYQGAALLSSGQTALQAGDPDTDLVKLVDKWFEGADLPAVWFQGATYKEAQGTLFGPDGPQIGDVAQGRAADCYFMASLGEAALQTPQVIQSMFTVNGDGTYAVRFYQLDAAGNWVADYITVNGMLPSHGHDQFVYANTAYGGQPSHVSNPNNVLWVALAEKAYAQLAEEGWSRGFGPSGSGGKYDMTSNSYSAIDYGYNEIAEQQITGFSDATWVTFDAKHPKQAAATLREVFADYRKGDLITFATWDHIHTKQNGLVGYHVYAMTGYDAANQTVTLTNPYTRYGQWTVTVSLSELENLFQGAAVVAPN
jgi:hypothetical protein